MSVSWLHVYILLIYVHIVHCKKYKTLLLPKPIQPIGSIIKDTPSNSIAFYYITFHSHSHDLGIPMDTTIWGNTPLLQPIWSEWLNYTRVCSEPCTICISREEPWQKKIRMWHRDTKSLRKSPCYMQQLPCFASLASSSTPCKNNAPTPLQFNRRRDNVDQNPAQVTMYHSINPPTGHENNQVLSLGITKHTCQPGTKNPGGKVLWQTAEVFHWFCHLSWCKCKWSEMHVNVFTMIHKSVANTAYVLFKSFKYLSVPRLSASSASLHMPRSS